MKFYVGCSGWRNVPWKDGFYPASIDSSQYLKYYSTIFDFVEVNLSDSAYGQNVKGTLSRSGRGFAETKDTSGHWFRSLAQGWTHQTPEHFHFAIRIPGNVLFSNPKIAAQPDSASDLISTSESIGAFLESLEPIKEKVITVTADVPQRVTLREGRGWLESVLRACKSYDYSLALRFGNKSWFQDLTYNLLKRHNGSIIWSRDLSQPYMNIVSVSNNLYFSMTAGTLSGAGRAGPSGYEEERVQFRKLIDMIKEKAQEDDNLEYAIIAVDHPANAKLIQEILGMVQRKNSTSEEWIPGLPDSLSKPSNIGINTDECKTESRIVVCVDLNAFYPSCEELRNPGLRGEPHAVIMTDQNEGEITQGVVSSCSYEARKYGVRSAMALSKAKSLCPDLVLLPVDIAFYAKVSEQVMQVLEPFGDVLEQASIDEAFLSCTKKLGGNSYADTLRSYGTSIKQAIKEKCGLLCSVGIAPTKSAAKIASDYEKPDGLTVLTMEGLKDFLKPLDVNRVSGIGPKTEHALKHMGITTLGQLANADVLQLKSRFGKNGHWMWKVANGTDDEPVTPRGDHVSISTETTLESFTRSKEEIRDIVHSLVNEIHERALHHGYSFRTVGVKLVRTDFSVATREMTYPEPQHEKLSIESAVEPLLDKFTLSDKVAAIRKVGLKLSHLARKDVIANLQHADNREYSTIQRTILDYT